MESELKEYHRNSDFSRHVQGYAWSKEDCKRFTNQEIISVKYHGANEDGVRAVWWFTEWDGETYEDQFLCSGPCIKRMAYGALHLYPSLHFPPYLAAINKAKGESK